MHELTLLSPQAAVDALSDAVIELGALSVSVEDADADTPLEQALFGEPDMPAPASAWQHSRVSALFDNEALAQEALRCLHHQPIFEACQVLGLKVVPQQDWVRLTQSQFEPVSITDDFYIVPTWCEAPSNARNIIRLDPGLAFGTGTHPTTRMCLQWIANAPHRLRHRGGLGRTLDYGCGSGILGIAASQYGASSVDAVDIDEVAVATAQSNAMSNHVKINCGLPQLVTGKYQTVMANILASPLKVLAPLLCGQLTNDGCLILAGILERQIEELKQAYKPYLPIQVIDQLDGWVLMGS